MLISTYIIVNGIFYHVNFYLFIINSVNTARNLIVICMVVAHGKPLFWLVAATAWLIHNICTSSFIHVLINQ